MFDCAACYGNEHEIGQVFKDAFDEGVVERKDLFIMTKVWNDMHRRVEEACDKSIKDLQCDYVDMYFIHWPFPNYHAPGCDCLLYTSAEDTWMDAVEFNPSVTPRIKAHTRTLSSAAKMQLSSSEISLYSRCV